MGKIFKLNIDNSSTELQTKTNFDTLGEMIKPESVNPGLKTKYLDSPHESDINGTITNSILPEVPNLYKHNGSFMENLGYFIIPRSVTSDPRYKSAPMKYQKVLHILFEYVAFAPTIHAIGCEIIQIAIGQFCVSEAYLTKICNEGVKYEDDLLTKTIVHRAIQFWKKCKIVNQEVNRGKNIITISVPEFYERLKKRSESKSEPQVNRPRITKEEDKEYKEDNIYSQKQSKKQAPYVASSFATSLLSEFYSSLFSAIPNFPKDSARKTKSQFQAADRINKKANGDMDLIRKVISYAHEPGGFWISLVHSPVYLDKKFNTLVQQLRSQGKTPMNGQKPQQKYQHDPRPRDPSKSISFAEEV